MSFLRRHRFGFPFILRQRGMDPITHPAAPWIWHGSKTSSAVPVGYVHAGMLHLQQEDNTIWDFTREQYLTGTPPHYCGGLYLSRTGTITVTDASTYTSYIKLAHQSNPTPGTSRSGSGGAVAHYRENACLQFCPPDFSPVVNVVTTPRHDIISTFSYNPITQIYSGSYDQTSYVYSVTCQNPSGAPPTVTNTVQNYTSTSAANIITAITPLNPVPTPTNSTTYSSGISYNAWITLARDTVAAYLVADAGAFSTDADEGSEFNLTESGGAFSPLNYPVAEIVYRTLRFFLPVSHMPTNGRILNCRITYDLRFFPAGGGASSIIAADQAVNLALDPAANPTDLWPYDTDISGWWFGSAIPIPPPTSPGITKIDNIRAEYSIAHDSAPYTAPPPQG